MVENMLRELGNRIRRDTERFLSHALTAKSDPRSEYRTLVKSLRRTFTSLPSQPTHARTG
jgi:hypothetical protein